MCQEANSPCFNRTEYTLPQFLAQCRTYTSDPLPLSALYRFQSLLRSTFQFQFSHMCADFCSYRWHLSESECDPAPIVPLLLTHLLNLTGCQVNRRFDYFDGKEPITFTFIPSLLILSISVNLSLDSDRDLCQSVTIQKLEIQSFTHSFFFLLLSIELYEEWRFQKRMPADLIKTLDEGDSYLVYLYSDHYHLINLGNCSVSNLRSTIAHATQCAQRLSSLFRPTHSILHELLRCLWPSINTR